MTILVSHQAIPPHFAAKLRPCKTGLWYETYTSLRRATESFLSSIHSHKTNTSCIWICVPSNAGRWTPVNINHSSLDHTRQILLIKNTSQNYDNDIWNDRPARVWMSLNENPRKKRNDWFFHAQHSVYFELVIQKLLFHWKIVYWSMYYSCFWALFNFLWKTFFLWFEEFEIVADLKSEHFIVFVHDFYWVLLWWFFVLQHSKFKICLFFVFFCAELMKKIRCTSCSFWLVGYALSLQPGVDIRGWWRMWTWLQVNFKPASQ